MAARSRSEGGVVTFLRFHTAFSNPRFRAFFEELSGLALRHSFDFNVHCLRSGDFLQDHTDDDEERRRLAFVFNLSPHWEARFGGALNFVEPGDKVTQLVPEHNSLVVFDVTTGSRHSIAPVRPAAGEQARFTISGWLY